MLDWFDRHGRTGLPWRADRDPYRVLVAEVMLVQTTVAAAGPYFEHFVARFPTAEALAAADEADVLKAWEGLGYYRRARQLQAAARTDRRRARRPGPRRPRRPPSPSGRRPIHRRRRPVDRLRPPEPILEANTQRVLARWLAWPDDVRSPASQAGSGRPPPASSPPRGPAGSTRR